MDDFASQAKRSIGSIFGADASSEESDNQVLIVGIAHALAGLFIWWLAKKCCCRDKKEVDESSAFIAEAVHLQPKKQLSSGYTLLFSGGLVGAHHFYLDRVVHGLLACWSLNFIGLGWLMDFFLMPRYVRGYNKLRCDDSAPLDNSRWLLMGKLPLITIFVLSGAVGFGICGPMTLQRLGVVDIDALAAQTVLNPYDVLGVERNADLPTAKAAYRKESLRWHPDRNIDCGKECDHKMSEITKAFDLIKTRKAPTDVNKTYQQMLEDLGRDWWYVLEYFQAKFNKEPEQEKKPREGYVRPKKKNDTDADRGETKDSDAAGGDKKKKRRKKKSKTDEEL